MKIYLASPYSHQLSAIRQSRFEIVNKEAARLINEGHIVFSPISHSHPIAIQEKLPLSADFWQSMNESFIDWCDAVYVLKLNKWELSNGIIEEIKYAKKHNKHIEYVEYVEYIK